MGKNGKSRVIVIMTMVVVCLVVGWVTTLVYHYNTVEEKDARIERSIVQMLQAELRGKQASDDLKICQDKSKQQKELVSKRREKVYEFLKVWFNIRKVKLSNSKYYVGLTEDDFFRLVNKATNLQKYFSPYYQWGSE